MIPLQHLTQGLNRQLDARQLLLAIGFRTDSITEVGTRLKCFCPIHRGETFKSLQIDPVGRTCQCILKECAAFTPMTLVDLYAHARRIPAAAAVIELSRLFQIPLEEATRRALIEQFEEAARAALEAKDFAGAARALSVLQAANPEDVALACRLAETEEKADEPALALESWVRAARLARRLDQPRAVEILRDHVLRLSPEHQGSLLELSRLQRALAPDDPSWARTLLRRAAVLRQAGQLEDAYGEGYAAAEALEADPAAQEEYGEIAAAAGRSGEAATAWRQAARLRESAGEDAHALRLLEKVLELRPQDSEAALQAAEIRARLGDVESYARDLLRLGQEALARGDGARAAACFDGVLRRMPDHCDALLGKAEAHALLGDGVAERLALESLLRLHQSRGEAEAVARVVERLRPRATGDSALLRLLGEAMAAADDAATAMDLLLEAVEAGVRTGQGPEAALAAHRFADLFPRQVEGVIQAAEELLKTGLMEEACQLYLRLSERLRAEGDGSWARILLEQAPEPLQTRPELLAELLSLIIEAEETEAVAPLARSLSALHRTAGRAEEAAQVLRVALAAVPGDAALKMDLAGAVSAVDADDACRLFAEVFFQEAAPAALRREAGQALRMRGKATPRGFFLLARLHEDAGAAVEAGDCFRAAGDAALAAGDEDLALSALENALRLAPGDSDGYRLAGELAQRRGNEERAAELFRHYLDAIVVTGTLEIIEAAFRRVARVQEDVDAWPLAFADWLESQGRSAEAAEEVLSLADRRTLTRDARQHLVWLHRVIRLDPMRPEPRLRRAELMLELQDREGAATELRLMVNQARIANEPSQAVLALERLDALGELQPGELLDFARFQEQVGNLPAAAALLKREAAHRAQWEADLDGEVSDMPAVYERILALTPEDNEVRELHAAALEAAGRLREAVEAWDALAALLAAQGDVGLALRSYDHLLELQPTRLPAREARLALLRSEVFSDQFRQEARALAEIHAGLGDIARAAALLEELVALEPRNARLLARLAEWRSLQGDLDQAGALWLAAAEALTFENKLREATEILEKLLLRAPRHLGGRLQMARILHGTGALDEAASEFLLYVTLALEQDPAALETVLPEAGARFSADLPFTEELCQRLTRAGRGDWAKHYLESLLDERESAGDASMALWALRRLATDVPAPPALRLREAALLLKSGAREEGTALFRHLLEERLAADAPQEALSFARQAVQSLPQEPAVRMLHLEALLRVEGVLVASDAIAEALPVLCLSTDLPAVAKLLRRLLDGGGDAAVLVEPLAEILAEAGDFTACQELLRARVDELEEGDPEAALRTLGTLVRLVPEGEDDHTRLRAVVRRLHGVEAARPLQIEALDRMAQQAAASADLAARASALGQEDPGHVALRGRLAELLADRGELAAACSEWEGVAVALDAAEDPMGAAQALRRAAALQPRRAPVRVRLAQILTREGDREQAVDAWMAVAELAREEGKLQDEVAARQQVVELLPRHADSWSLLAEACLRAGQEREAVPALRQVVELHVEAAEFEKNIPVLEQLLLLVPEGRDARALLAEAYERQGQLSKATEQRLRLIAELRRVDDPRAALEVALAGKESDPEEVGFRTALLALCLELNLEQEFADEVADFARLRQKNEDVRGAIEVLAQNIRLLFQRGAYAVAIDLLEAFYSLQIDVPELMGLRAEGLERLGREEDAMTAWMHLAELHTEMEQGTEAESALRRAIALRPQDVRLRRALLANLVSRPADGDSPRLVPELMDLASLHLSRSEVAEAAELYRQILQEEPTHLEALEALSSLLFGEEQFEEARDMLVRLGSLQLELGHLEEARAAFEKVVHIEPQNPRALRGLLEFHNRRGDHAEWLRFASVLAQFYELMMATSDAVAMHEAIRARDPRDLPSREKLAEHYALNNDFIRAAGLLREVYDLQREDGDFHEALDTLRRLDLVDPGNPHNLELLGRTHVLLGDAEHGLEYLQTAAGKMVLAGEFAAALPITDELLKDNPQNIEALELRGEIFVRLDRRAEAAALFTKLAELALSEEEPERALEAFQRALAADSTDCVARRRLAQLLEELDRPSEAAREYLKLSDESRSSGDLAGARTAAEAAHRLGAGAPAWERLAELYEGIAPTAAQEDVLLRLAEHQEKCGQPERALATLRRLPGLDAKAALLLRAARLEAALSHREEAARLYARGAEAARAERNAALEREALAGQFNLDPSDLTALRALLQLFIAAGDRAGSTRLLLDAMDHQLSVGEVDSALELASEARDLAVDPADLRERSASLFDTHELPELAARERIEAGKLRAEAGDPEAALRLADAALSQIPSSHPAQELRFSMLLALGRDEDAFEEAARLEASLSDMHIIRRIALCREMIRLRPKDPAPRRRLIGHLAREGADAAQRISEWRALADLHVERGEAQQAVEILRELLASKPDDTRARIRLIDTYRAVGSESDLTDDYLKLAEIHTRHGALLEARKTYERVLELAPGRLQARERFVQFLTETGQHAAAAQQCYVVAEQLLQDREPRRALEVLNRIRAHAAADPAFHHLLGRIHLLTNARGMAARELRQAAELYGTAQDFPRQAEVLTTLLSIDPLNLETRQAHIDALLASGRKDQALEAMEQLAHTYLERRLPDDAEAELRRILKIDPNRPETWKSLFRAHQEIGQERDLLPDFLEFADMMARHGEVREALDYYIKVIEHDPRNIAARRGYVTHYPKIGKIRDIVDDVLALAHLLVEEGQVDDATRYFALVMAIDPQNTHARDMLSSTQARSSSQVRLLAAAAPEDVDSQPGAGSGSGGDWMANDSRLSETQKRFLQDRTGMASEFLQGELENLERKENEEALAQVLANYRDILAVNAQNAAIRIKLANVLEQMGRIPEMLNELVTASDTLFAKGDLGTCVEVSERYLRWNPTDQKMRKRLSEAIIKRDALRALESEILYPEEAQDKPR